MTSAEGTAQRGARTLAWLRSVVGGPDEGTIVILGLLVVLQWSQLAMVALAGLLVDWGRMHALLVASAAGLLLRAIAGVVRTGASTRVQVAFTRRAAEYVCSTSALAVGPSDSAQAWFFRALLASRELLVDVYPTLISNGLAIATFGPLVMSRMPLKVVPWIVLMCIVTATAYAALGRAHQIRLALAQDEDQSFYSALGLITDGHLEIVAGGAARQHVDATVASALRWSRMRQRSSAVGAIGGYLPVALAAAAGAMMWLYVVGRDATWSAAAEMFVFASLVPAVVGLAHGGVRARSGLVDLTTFLSMMEAPPDPGWTSAATGVPNLSGDVVFDDVTFDYSRSGRAIDRLSFVWGPEAFLALAGPNGSGKSTVLRLILRICDPSIGRVRIGGSWLTDVDICAWRRALAFVPQRSHLPVGGTVGDAMRVYAVQISDDVLRSWLERVGLGLALRTRFGDPLAAPLDVLSSGQRQRLCLARAFAADRPILMLDEPETNLDPAGVEMLVGILSELKSTRRLMVVAHSPAILAAADHVVWLGRHVDGDRVQ